MSGETKRIASWEQDLARDLGAPWHVRCYECVGSTMDVAAQMLDGGELGKHSAALVLAQKQMDGRGRQGRVWASADKNFYATFVFPAGNDTARCAGLSLMIGCELSELCEMFGVPSKVKWPNDLLALDSKKLAGILIDVRRTSMTGEAYLLIGIGVNLYAAPPGVPATSLFDICGREIAPVPFAALLSTRLAEAVPKFLLEGLGPWRARWLARAALLHEEVRIDLGGEIVCGIVRDIDERGLLIIDLPGGTSRALAAGHIGAV